MKVIDTPRAAWSEGRGERGASATEYGLLVVLIAFVTVAGAGALFGSVGDWFQRMVATLTPLL